MDRDTLELRHAWSKGRCMMRDGELVVRAGWLAESKREIVLLGDERPDGRASVAVET